MENPLKTFLKALFGKSDESASKEEINAAMAGDMVTREAAKKIGFVEKVDVDANEARRQAQVKTTVKERAGRTN